MQQLPLQINRQLKLELAEVNLTSPYPRLVASTSTLHQHQPPGTILASNPILSLAHRLQLASCVRPTHRAAATGTGTPQPATPTALLQLRVPSLQSSPSPPRPRPATAAHVPVRTHRYPNHRPTSSPTSPSWGTNPLRPPNPRRPPPPLPLTQPPAHRLPTVPTPLPPRLVTLATTLAPSSRRRTSAPPRLPKLHSCRAPASLFDQRVSPVPPSPRFPARLVVFQARPRGTTRQGWLRLRRRPRVQLRQRAYPSAMSLANPWTCRVMRQDRRAAGRMPTSTQIPPRREESRT